MNIRAQITTSGEAPSVEKMFMENTLLRIGGALFCHDAKRASKRFAPIVLNRIGQGGDKLFHVSAGILPGAAE